MTISRTTSGLLFKDYFDTDTTSTYYTPGGIVTYQNQSVLLGNGLATSWGSLSLQSSYLNQKNAAITGKLYFGATTKTTQYLYIYLRYSPSRWYRVGIKDGTTGGNTLVAEYYNGSTVNTIQSASYTINRDVWYNFKFVQYDAATKFKMWPEGQAEPANWSINSGMYDSGTTGAAYWYAYQLDSTIDNTGIYLNHDIKCTGLPTGYKFRIGGVGGAVAAESGGTATVDCLNLSFPASLVEVLDASDTVVSSLTLTGDVWGGDEYSYISATNVADDFFCDSTLKKNVQSSAVTGSVLKKDGLNGSLTADASLSVHREISHPFDSVIKKSVSHSYSSDTVIGKTLQRQLTVDTKLLKRYEGSCAAEGILRKQQDRPVIVDAVLKKQGLSGSYTADAYFSPDQAYTLSRSTTGKLLVEPFDTNNLGNYTTGGTAVYNSANKRVELGADSSTSSGWLQDNAFDQNDYVFTARLTQLGSGVYSYSLTYLFIRRLDSGSTTEYVIEINDSSDTIRLYREHSDGSLIEIAPAVAFSPARGTTYIAKFSAIGSAIKFKLWDAGITEPQSWMMEATDSYFTHGKWDIYSYQLKTGFDDIFIYKSHNVTCSGLADGQKFRVGGAGGKVAVASGGVATVDCSHLTFPVSLVEVLDASDNVVMSYTATDDIWGGDSFEMKFYRKFYADATLIKGGVKPVTLDAVLKRGGLGSFTSEVLLRAAVSGTATVNAVTRKNTETSFMSNALAWRYGGTITGLSVLKKFGMTASFNAAADLQPFIQVVKGITADCMLFKPGFTVTIPADAVFKKYLQETMPADARLMRRLATGLKADARMQWVRNGTITVLSVLRKIVSPSYTGSAVISKQCVIVPILINADIRRQLSAAMNSDAVLFKGVAVSITAQATINKVIQGNFTVNAGLPARYTGNILAGAYLTKTRVAEFIPETVLFKIVNRSIGADAYIWDMDRYLIDLAVIIEKSFQIDVNATRAVDLSLNLTRQAIFDLNVGFN